MEETWGLSSMYRKAQVWIASDVYSSSPKFLIFKVVEARGGGWHPITGSIEKGETFLSGAKRELEEETGISPQSGRWVFLDSHATFTDRRGSQATEHAFGLILKDQPMTIHLDPTELTEFKWATFQDAKEALSFEPQQRALEAFLCYLQDHVAPSSR